MIIMITPRTTILKLFADLDVAGKQAAEEWTYIKISINRVADTVTGTVQPRHWQLEMPRDWRHLSADSERNCTGITVAEPRLRPGPTTVVVLLIYPTSRAGSLALSHW